MTTQIPESHKDLFIKSVVATLITLMPDGSPQGTVVWCRLHGNNVQIAILTDTQKYENLQQNPNVSVVIVDTNEPYRYIEVRGRATLSTENATPIIKDIATKYGRPDFDVKTNEHRRVIITIEPTKVTPHG